MTVRINAGNLAAHDGLDVLDACHRDILLYLERLDALVARLDRGATDAEVLKEARLVAAFFSGPVREHNFDEELHVFPAILTRGDEASQEAAKRLTEDHAWIELYWLDVEEQLEFALAGAPIHRIPLHAAAQSFMALQREHIALEESLLYPVVRGWMKAPARRSMAREMAGRRARAQRSAAASQ